jgi:hypothetical protein
MRKRPASTADFSGIAMARAAAARPTRFVAGTGPMRRRARNDGRHNRSELETS